MTTALPSRPATNGTAHSSTSTNPPRRQPSLSSFPSRTPSEQSLRNAPLPARRYRGHGSQSSVQTSNSSQRQHSIPPTTVHRTRKLKSQYPADSTERHVEYILVASFDIDKGPVMEHQFPGPISGDEGMLAELMLPDQAHVRSEDWTIFFLHKDTSEEEGAREERRTERRQRREERAKRLAEGGEHMVNGANGELGELGSDVDSDEGGEGPPLIYVLNLVNMKQDKNARRGAVVKAMAICTRHPFLHIYKPLLLLALEEYFKAPTLDTLEQLYDSVNSMDLSLMPRLSLLERHILQATDNKEIFMEKFDQMIQQRIEEEGATHYDLRSRYQLPRDTHEYETRVMYNSIPIPIKVPTAVSPETVGDFSLVKLITTFSSPHTSSPQPFALHPHLTTNGAFTHPILVLVNAVLTQKRVVFLGHNRPSGEVAEAVLAACALVSGSILRGFTRHAFPYTDLTKIDDLLNVPGFIAGVTNPTFANHHEWWDLLCDIPSGRMKISSKIEPAPPTEGLTFFQQQHPTYAPSNTGILPPAVTTSASTGSGSSSSGDPAGDAAFMEDILRSIASRHGEPALRSKFRDYIVKFTRLAAAFEEAVYGASALHIGTKETEDSALGVSGHGYVWPDENTRARELAANVWRIEGWRMTRSYYALIQDLAALWGRKPIRGIDVEHHLERLRFLKLGKEESRAIFTALDRAVAGYDEVCQLLVATPESHAGLFYLSLGLWHPKKEARVAAAGLLERVRGHEAGRHFWSGLGRFAKVAFMRVRREAESEGVDGDVGGGMSDSQVFRPRTRGRD